MKIAYILPSLRKFGPVVVVRSLAKWLLKMGHQVDVFYFDEVEGNMDFPCPCHHISMKEAFDFDQYEIIHTHCLRPDLYMVRWKRRVHKAKMVSTLHQDTYMTFRYEYNAVKSYVLTLFWCFLQSRYDAVVTISNQLKDTYKKKIRTHLQTIYNGCVINESEEVDRTVVNHIVALRTRYKILGTYALVTRRKGVNQVLEALKILPDYALVIIGDGPDIDRLKELAEKYGVKERVLFVPHQKAPYNYLSLFDIYIMPSYSEGFGLAMVEAALAKKAVVCSELPSFNEIFSHEEASFFELDHIQALSNAIIYAFEHKDRMAQLAYEKAVACFTEVRMTEMHIAFYQELIAGLKS